MKLFWLGGGKKNHPFKQFQSKCRESRNALTSSHLVNAFDLQMKNNEIIWVVSHLVGEVQLICVSGDGEQKLIPII